MGMEVEQEEEGGSTGEGEETVSDELTAAITSLLQTETVPGGTKSPDEPTTYDELSTPTTASTRPPASLSMASLAPVHKSESHGKTETRTDVAGDAVFGGTLLTGAASTLSQKEFAPSTDLKRGAMSMSSESPDVMEAKRRKWHEVDDRLMPSTEHDTKMVAPAHLTVREDGDAKLQQTAKSLASPRATSCAYNKRLACEHGPSD